MSIDEDGDAPPIRPFFGGMKAWTAAVTVAPLVGSVCDRRHDSCFGKWLMVLPLIECCGCLIVVVAHPPLWPLHRHHAKREAAEEEEEEEEEEVESH